MFKSWKSQSIPSSNADYEGLLAQDEPELATTIHKKSSDLVVYWVKNLNDSNIHFNMLICFAYRCILSME
jgi:hypothetical protein